MLFRAESEVCCVLVDVVFFVDVVVLLVLVDVALALVLVCWVKSYTSTRV